MTNRITKFRAWDTESKFMILPEYGDWVSFDGVPYTEANRKYDTPNIEIEKAKNYILMEWTGLKDKDKTEIYVGDIVEFVGGTCSFIPCGIYSYQRHEIGTHLLVSKLLSGYTLQIPRDIDQDIPNIVGNVDNYVFWNHQNSFKVIGNIYQTPELIEDNNGN